MKVKKKEKVENKIRNVGNKTYKDTVSSGFYDKYTGGLWGKFDNVRIYWEDQITKSCLRPYVRNIVNKFKSQKGIRILDLGCGSGQGYELLSKISKKEISLDFKERFILPPELISFYLGVDISNEMIEKGNENYKRNKNIHFRKMDLGKGLDKSIVGEKGFNIYFSSYAPLSHLKYGQVKNLLIEISKHAIPGAIVMLDFLGRFSIEWPEYWNATNESDKIRDYSMSYLYQKGVLKGEEIEHFPVRYWSGEEITILCKEIENEIKIRLRPLHIFDRSILVGRHIDTGEYNKDLKPLRRIVNKLHEDYMRTDLESLIIDYIPKSSFEELNKFFKKMIFSWNTLVKFTNLRLKKRIYPTEMKGWSKFNSSLQQGIMNMDRVIDSVIWMKIGDPRANIIEPQLAYTLRNLEHDLQKGLGCGHGLVAILKIK